MCSVTNMMRAFLANVEVSESEENSFQVKKNVGKYFVVACPVLAHLIKYTSTNHSIGR